MADAYKGLTIQIGADTTSLTKALKAANKAASETQSQLRKMQNAMNFDGTDSRAVTQQLKAMSEQSSALTKKAATLRKELDELDGAGIGKLASQTKDAAYQAEKAKEAYAKVVAQIKAYKNAISKKYVDGFDVNKISTDPFAKLKESAEGLAVTSEKVEAEMRRLGATEEEVEAYTKQLVPAFKEASAALDTANKVSAYGKVKTDLVETEAKAKSLRAEFTKLSESHPASSLSAEFLKAGERAEYFSGKVSEARSTLSALESAFNLNPASVQTATARFVAMANAITESKNQLEEMRVQLSSLEASGAAKTATDVKNLSSALLSARERVVELKGEIERIDAANGIDGTKTDVKQLEAELATATERMNELAAAEKYVKLQGDFSKLEAELEALASKTNTATSSFNSLRGMMQNLGWSMTATVGSAMTIFASKAIDAAQEVDSAYRDMRKTVNGTEEQFEELYNAALEYSTSHVTSAEDILEIEALGGQLGVATNKLESFATVVSNLDIATDLDAETAAEQLGQLSGILNDMSDDDFEKYGDALTRLGNNNSTLESKISDVMLRISSMGTITGFTTPQLLAWSTAIAATGQGAESSGTAISKTMSNIESAVGAGGEKLQAFAKVANMSATEFANAWKTDPSSAMQQFIQGLADIEANGGSADSTLVSLGITSVRQKQALLGLMQTIGTLNDNLTMSQDAWDGVSDSWGDAGDAAREAERKAEGFSGAVTLMQNAFENLGVEVGSTVQPLIEGLASVLSALTTTFQNSPSSVKAATVAMVALFAAFGPGLIAVTAVMNAWETLKKTFTESAVLQAAKTQASAAGVAFEEMAAGEQAAAVGMQAVKKVAKTMGIVAIVAAVGALVSKLVDFVDEQRTAREAVTSMETALNTAKAGFSGYAESVALSTDEVVSSANEALSSTKELGDTLQSSFSDVGANETELNTYVDTINRLAGNCDGSAGSLWELKTAVDKYNEITGDSITVTNSQTGELSKSTEEINKNAAAWKKNAEIQAYQEAYTETVKQRAKNEEELSKVEAQLSEKQGDLNDAIENNTISSADNSAAVFTQQREVSELQSKADQLQASIDECSEAEEFYSGKAKESTESTQQQSESTGEATTKATLYAAALGKTSDEFSTLVSDTTSAVESNSNLKTLFEQTGLSAEDFAYALSACGTSASDLSSDLDTMVSKVQNAFDTITAQNEVSVEEMMATLESNITTATNWSAGLQELYAKAGDGAMKSFVDAIAAKGPEYASTVAALNNATDEQWAQLAADWEAAGKAGVEAGAAGVNASAGTLTGAVTAATESAKTAAQQSGSDTGAAYSDGIASKQGEASSAAGWLAQATDEEIQQTKDTAWQIGAATGSNYAVGVWNKTGEAGAAGTGIGNAAVNPLSDFTSPAYEWGQHLGSNFAAGISSTSGEVDSASAAIAATASANLKHSIAKKGPLHNGGKGEKPWGAHLVQNFMAGIQSELPEFNRTMATVAKAAAGYMSSAGGSATLAGGGASVKLASPQLVVNVETPKSSSAAIVSGLTQLNESLGNFANAAQETAIYVDGKKLASTIAKPMNQQLGILSRRGA